MFKEDRTSYHWGRKDHLFEFISIVFTPFLHTRNHPLTEQWSLLSQHAYAKGAGCLQMYTKFLSFCFSNSSSGHHRVGTLWYASVITQIPSTPIKNKIYIVHTKTLLLVPSREESPTVTCSTPPAEMTSYGDPEFKCFTTWTPHQDILHITSTGAVWALFKQNTNT